MYIQGHAGQVIGGMVDSNSPYDPSSIIRPRFGNSPRQFSIRESEPPSIPIMTTLFNLLTFLTLPFLTCRGVVSMTFFINKDTKREIGYFTLCTRCGKNRRINGFPSISVNSLGYTGENYLLEIACCDRGNFEKMSIPKTTSRLSHYLQCPDCNESLIVEFRDVEANIY